VHSLENRVTRADGQFIDMRQRINSTIRRLRLRALIQIATGLLFTTALAAAPIDSTPYRVQGMPGQMYQTKPTIKRSKSQVGNASWYGRLFQQKRTASGEPFDMYRLTAAHRTLPLGSWVKVTDLKNARSVIVRINDRGPVPKNRIIDLSYRAAKMLGMSESGIHPVRVELLDNADHIAE